MARSGDPKRSTGPTKIRDKRIAAGKSQSALSIESGISLSTLQRLESGAIDNPQFAWIANLAIALECDFDELVELRWTQWHTLSKYAPRPPQEMPTGTSHNSASARASRAE